MRERDQSLILVIVDRASEVGWGEYHPLPDSNYPHWCLQQVPRDAHIGGEGMLQVNTCQMLFQTISIDTHTPFNQIIFGIILKNNCFKY